LGDTIGPELAAAVAAKATGAKVFAVPELLMADVIYAGEWDHWRITLDRPVSLRVLSSNLERVVPNG
jgi:hypothetical protein